MKILLIPAAGGVGLGPLTNILAIAEESKRAGHQVALICKNSWQPFIRRLGYEFFPAPSPNPYHGPMPPPFKLSDVIIGLGWVEESYIRASIQAEREAIASFRADVVVTMLQLTAPISAAIEQIPNVGIASWADGPQFTSPLYRQDQYLSGWEEAYNRVLDEFSLDPIADICELSFMRSDLRIAPTIPELQPEFLSLPGIHFIGHLLSEQMETGELPNEINKWIDDGKIIYVYMSPGDIEPHQWIPIVVEAFEGTEFHAMVTLAPLSASSVSIPPSLNVQFFERLPGTSAISKSDLVISHGGANTVTNALLCGVPQMVFPDKYAERDYNGRSIQRVGAGLNCSTEQFTPKELRETCFEIATHNSFRLNAAKIGDRIREFGGSRQVVQLIESEL